ncbi:DUF262 domain-containing protein [Salegentibacter sp. F188]|uniref:DUF262 domain-containing protein n=1 Tax=Autumnicola patrickiae TaxID=3075591 RepID=A0ABU3E0C8_9FLAO|nr:DUF262 domain-containing protein [Salegentibacter sp. F188]MDT0688737.1 DUF262 domain-containing protein [Salegentibacter sp. F188]
MGHQKEVLSDNTHFKQKPIKELAGKTFLVEDYQRGYKWDFNQVLDLLEDINSFNSHGNLDSYCLQPVAVKADPDVPDEYELVDGQQRLTTIYIILKICGGKNLFDIYYRTRTESELFLRDIHPFLDYKFEYRKDQFKREIENSLNQKWKKYIEDSRNDEENQENYDNVDNYHFFQAALIIRSYFDRPEIDKDQFLDKLKEKVKVIWYQDPTDETANKLFKNLNSGKIRLSASDLIKALFILKLEKADQLPAQIEFEQNKLASEWDDIEQQLHESKFWSFIIGNTSRNYEDSRIGYLFEVLTDTIDHKNVYECYRRYSDANAKAKLNWNTVTDLFFTLREWFDDIKTYHRIGFLMRQNIKDWRTLRHIHERYQNVVDKDTFKKNLEEQLKELFRATQTRDKVEISIYSLDSISYHDLPEVRNLLVLLNILTYERIMPDYRLDFDQFYSGKWSVEHIQPQNPKDLSFDNVAIYLEEMGSLIKNEDTDSDSQFGDVRAELDQLINSMPEAVTEKEQRDYLLRFNNFVEENITDRFELHGIGNLALLRSAENSSLGNNSFKSKREQILNFFNSDSKEGSFIPISTLQVFTKFHSEDSLQLDFWSYRDAMDYKKNIAEMMKNFLPENK